MSLEQWDKRDIFRDVYSITCHAINMAPPNALTTTSKVFFLPQQSSTYKS